MRAEQTSHNKGISRERTSADEILVQAINLFEIGDRSTSNLHPVGLNTVDGKDRRALTLRTKMGDRTDVMRNFRELLWFWSEYYTHRGRDRLSLEFSSHLRFHEWKNVVGLLCADDGSTSSLVQNRVRLPKSPYRRAARIVDNRLRGY